MYCPWNTYHIMTKPIGKGRLSVDELLCRGDELYDYMLKSHNNLLSVICNIDLHVINSELYVKTLTREVTAFVQAVEEAHANTMAIEIYDKQFDEVSASKLFGELYDLNSVHNYEPNIFIIFANVMPSMVEKIYKQNPRRYRKFLSKISAYIDIFNKSYKHKEKYTEVIYRYGSYLFMQHKIDMHTKLVFSQ